MLTILHTAKLLCSEGNSVPACGFLQNLVSALKYSHRKLIKIINFCEDDNAMKCLSIFLQQSLQFSLPSVK